MKEDEAPGGSARRRARERALQALYQSDFGRPSELGRPSDTGGGEPFGVYWQSFGDEDAPAREQAEALVAAVESQRARIDALIEECSTHWRLDRMSRVDRNILRLAAGEMIAALAPKSVVINEAVEIAKRYGAEGSAAFVNGVLDRLATRLGL
jgi:N utilization substance protein B